MIVDAPSLPQHERDARGDAKRACDGYATIMRRLCGTLATIMRQLRDTRFVASRVGPNRTGPQFFVELLQTAAKCWIPAGSSEPVPAKGAWRSLYEHKYGTSRATRKEGRALARPLILCRNSSVLVRNAGIVLSWCHSEERSDEESKTSAHTPGRRGKDRPQLQALDSSLRRHYVRNDNSGTLKIRLTKTEQLSCATRA